MILDCNDKPGCKTIYGVFNKYFGRDYEMFQKAFLHMDKAKTIGVWFPMMAIKENGKIKAQSKTKEWINVMSDDGSEIHMYSVSDLEGGRGGEEYHITFAKEDKKSNYTFVGVYKRNMSRSTSKDHYFELVSRSIDVSPWENGNIPDRYDDEYLLKRYNSNNDALVTDVEKELSIDGLSGESRDAIVKVRINQGVFRDRLLQKYDKCCLCNVSNKNLLIASHIKPWSVSDKKERVDINNGFMFCPNHDKLFDQGYISFDDNGRILISDSLAVVDRIFMNVNDDMIINLEEDNRKYLEYHRNNILR